MQLKDWPSQTCRNTRNRPQDCSNLLQLKQKLYPIFCNRGYNRIGLQFS